MDHIVSVAQFRSNISEFLQKVSTGARLSIRDEKRGVVLAHIVGAGSVFDPSHYAEILDRAQGVFSAKRYPHWSTEKALSRWLTQGRLADERTI